MEIAMCKEGCYAYEPLSQPVNPSGADYHGC